MVEIYLNNEFVGEVGGSEAVGEAWCAIKRLAELFGTNCYMIDYSNGLEIAHWEP